MRLIGIELFVTQYDLMASWEQEIRCDQVKALCSKAIRRETLDRSKAPPHDFCGKIDQAEVPCDIRAPAVTTPSEKMSSAPPATESSPRPGFARETSPECIMLEPKVTFPPLGESIRTP